MADVPISITDLGGGLNTGSIALNNTESSDLANVDFDRFGSFKKRKGYYWLNRLVIGTSTGLDFDINEMPHVALNWQYTIGSTTV